MLFIHISSIVLGAWKVFFIVFVRLFIMYKYIPIHKKKKQTQQENTIVILSFNVTQSTSIV